MDILWYNPGDDGASPTSVMPTSFHRCGRDPAVHSRFDIGTPLSLIVQAAWRAPAPTYTEGRWRAAGNSNLGIEKGFPF